MAESPAEPQALFLALASSANLTDPAIKPWHLRLSFDLRTHVDQLSTFVPGDDEFRPSGEQTVLQEGLGSAFYDAPPKLLAKTAPEYPASAREAHISGVVVLNAMIDEIGHVDSLSVVHSPDPSLSRAAIAAVRQWRYEPVTQEGRAVRIDTYITVNFNMGR